MVCGMTKGARRRARLTGEPTSLARAAASDVAARVAERGALAVAGGGAGGVAAAIAKRCDAAAVGGGGAEAVASGVVIAGLRLGERRRSAKNKHGGNQSHPFHFSHSNMVHFAVGGGGRLGTYCSACWLSQRNVWTYLRCTHPRL